MAASYGAVLLFGILLGQNYADENHNYSGTSILPLGMTDKTGKVQRLIDLIASNYVDSLNIDELQNLAVDEIIRQLDPHSEYLSPAAASQQSSSLEGTFDGIGIEYYMLNDTLLTVGIVSEGPADKAGIRVGDKLLAIDQIPVAGVHITERELDERIRGKRGSTIALSVKRGNVSEPLSIQVSRDKIQVSSLDAAYLIDSATAYLKIRRFGAKTVEEFKQALATLKEQGADRLILDLRENGGGYLRAATELLGEFFSKKELLVYTKGAYEPRTDYFANTDGLFGHGKVAVLIDRQSASGSEIVAGAIQDLGRGTIIGQRSFGKGLVQEQFGFGDGSVLNLTVARYYTPSGRSIQKPYKKQKPENNNHMLANHQPPTVQVDSSYNGGIVPDIYVPLPATGQDSLWLVIRKKNLVETFVYGRLTSETPSYAIEQFLRNYALPQARFEDFIAYINEQGVACNAQQAAQLQPVIQPTIEALLSRYFFGKEAYFKVKNRTDSTVLSALRVLADGDDMTMAEAKR